MKKSTHYALTQLLHVAMEQEKDEHKGKETDLTLRMQSLLIEIGEAK